MLTEAVLLDYISYARSGRAELAWVDLRKGSPSLAFDLLGAREKERSRRFQNDRSRTAYVLRRAALRGVLADFLGVAPERITFTNEPSGKPTVAWPTDPTLGYSTAWSHDWAVIAVVAPSDADNVDLRVGVDLERKVPLPYRQIAEAAWGAEESSRIIENNEPCHAFFTTWTAYEACVKMRGARLVDGPSLSLVQRGARVSHELPGCPQGYISALAMPSPCG